MLKNIKTLLIIILSVFIITVSLGAGCEFWNTNVPETTEVEELDILKEVWDIIHRDYVEIENLDATSLKHGAIRGMLEALDDPHTAFLDADTYNQWLSSIEGKYEGIGAYVGFEDEQIIIIAPIPGYPAAESGIRAGDIILEIDGKSTEKMSIEEAVLYIRGTKGTSVKLVVLHNDETEPVELEITRAEIELASVTFEMREDIAYIYIAHFTERTNAELTSILQEIIQEQANGIILDLRNNPGGLLLTVIDVANHFLDGGVILYVVDNEGNKSMSRAKKGGLVTEIPVIVLVNEFSASGSEVLAGALQDNGRAEVAGTITFGKGSVNIHRKLSDGSALYITNGRWLTPGERVIEGQGIEPDYILELEGEEAIQWAIDYLVDRK